ncbi:MAG: PQQ-binding-like beta-propeller repeat protein [Chitinophagaceae bacterium]|jgi:quinoprotein glucose dehydrogenase|nr:PQQ-binding-like beta-propeller repeat protein [Chitinophagaceae bacterium]
MKIICTIVCLCLVAMIACNQRSEKNTDWLVYGGGKDSRHYSPLMQIDTSNVSQLKVAWTYHTGDADSNTTQIQANGLEAGGIFYSVSPRLKLFALEASTGKPIWVFDPAADPIYKNPGNFSMNVCRGITLYHEGDDTLIFYAAASRLFCVNAKSGKTVPTFGQGGSIDLHEGFDRDVSNLYVATTSPGIIYKDLIIIGDRVNEETPAAPGDIRAFDVHTGKRRWIFHTVPLPGEPGYETWEDTAAYHYAGAANAWSGFSLDEKRGIVFAPTGSNAYDFYGGKRKGQNLYANCVLALDAATGKRIWHFQTVHHDLWDRDLPTAPVLVNIKKDNKEIEAIAQITKSGLIFLFDRQTGEPVYPIKEMPVPTESELKGEQPSATQPMPIGMPAFARQSISDSDLNRLVPDSSYQDIKRRFAGYHNGRFQLPSREGTIIFPGFDGGGEWGGPAYDPETGILYTNAGEIPNVLTMVDVFNPATKSSGANKKSNATTKTNLEAGKELYVANCMSCHGPDRKGSGNNPSLLNAHTMRRDSFEILVAHGRRMMPAFANLAQTEKKALASFILDIKELQNKRYTPPVNTISEYDKMVYTSTGYNKFLTKEGYAAIMPPWGTLTAIDLNQGRVVWKDTLGDFPEFEARGIHTGTENYGGPVVTAGGLLFIAATRDNRIRAFNKRTGQMLWQAELPACGFATPTVYQINGKQYLVIACGGGKLKMPSGDSYVAFALP